MLDLIRDDLSAVRDAFAELRPDADRPMLRLAQRLAVADPEELLESRIDERGLRALLTGWIANRLACLSRERTDITLLETTAAIVASLGDTADEAAALGTLLRGCPSSIPRLAHCSRERVNGLGEPLGRRGEALSKSAQRVAIAFEAGRRLTVALDKTDEILAGLQREAERGYWSVSLLNQLPAAVAAIAAVHASKRETPAPAPKQRTYRISQAHALAGPHQLERLKKRQRIASRHVANGPSQMRRRGGRRSGGRG